MNKTFSIIINLILAIDLLTNGYFMLSNGQVDKLWWWLLAFGFFVWVAVPYVGIVIANKRISRNIISQIIFLITSLFITVGGIYILIETFIKHLDPQSGLIFIFLPFFQCIVVATGIGLAFLTKALAKRVERY
jgi:hypothetical protein